jgi:hypothetical protein
MEKMSGQQYEERNSYLSVPQQKKVLKTMITYTKELSSLSFDKIGSLYCNWDAQKPESYIGPAVDMEFLKASRYLYHTERGSFSNLMAYFTAFLHLKLQEVSDRHQQQRAHGALDLLAQMERRATGDNESWSDENNVEAKEYYEPDSIIDGCHRFQRSQTPASLHTEPPPPTFTSTI